ncbi:MAG: phytanoyl-CoA dioxygenase family protein [Candidatus Poribacteria bacterium]|nr:phytanoyl-CoA dioxygenase family protein [Candidatus Poribacteria bacterium]
MKLTQEERRQFADDGYLIYEALINGEKLAGYQAMFDGFVEKSKTLPVGTPHYTYELTEDRQQIPGFLHKIQGVCVAEPPTLSLAMESEIVERIIELIGENVDVFGTKFFPKLPNGGTSVWWHQDNFYFGTNSDEIISCGIYLQDADEENGCLRILPGSHLKKEIVVHEPAHKTYGSWTEVDESKALDVVCPAGTVVLFGANLLHGSYDNVSDRPRYSTAWHYVPDDVAQDRFPNPGYSDRHIVRRAE